MRKNPWVAAALSAVPGAGHLYLDLYKKGLALLCISAGVIAGVFFSGSYLVVLLVFGVYFVTALSAMIETFRTARTGEIFRGFDSKTYIAFMLLATGFSAVPLLWQSQSYSRRGKIVWTVAVAALAVLFLGGLSLFWFQLEVFFERLFAK